MLTPQQIQDLRKKAGLSATPPPAVSSSSTDIINARKSALGIEEKPQGDTGIKGVATGVGKGVLSTLKGAVQLGGTIGEKILPGFKSPYSEEKIQASAEKGGLGKLFTGENLKAKGTAENIGKGVEQIAEFAIPATKVFKLTKGASMVGKIIPRAITSGTVASVQSGKVGKEAGIAAAVETALPVVGKVLTPVKNIVSRLVKGLAAGTSGVGTETIDKLVTNASMAGKEVKQLKALGNAGVLKKNAETIVNGVSKIKKEARTAYGVGLEALKATDIKPKEFRTGVQSIFDDYGSVIKGNTREITNAEFKDINNLKKASSIFDKISNTKLDGKSLKSILDSIEKTRYPNPKTEEAMAFNSFVGDITNRLKSTISKSTNKLNEINAAYTKDMQLAESIEQIFGKVKFKNIQEVNKVSQKLESLFSQKGLSPEYVDDFLNRIGIKPEQFTTSEAVRQITNKTTGANTKGLSIGEIIQQVTSSVITPKLVRDIAIKTGKSEVFIKKLLENTAPTARAAIIKSLIPSK